MTGTKFQRSLIVLLILPSNCHRRFDKIRFLVGNVHISIGHMPFASSRLRFWLRLCHWVTETLVEILKIRMGSHLASCNALLFLIPRVHLLLESGKLAILRS